MKHIVYKTKLKHFFSQNSCPPTPEILTGVKYMHSSSVRVSKYAPCYNEMSRLPSDDHEIFIFARKHAAAFTVRSPSFFTLLLTHVVVNEKIKFFPSLLTQHENSSSIIVAHVATCVFNERTLVLLIVINAL